MEHYITEQAAQADLDTCGYPDTWEKAKSYVSEFRQPATAPAYWDAVRLVYLELGGGWLADRRPAAPIDWAADVSRAGMPALALLTPPGSYVGDRPKLRQG